MPQRPVRTVMHSPVHALRADTPAREAERFLTEHNIGGAPVLDDKGCVVGVLSQRDLLRLESAAPSANATGAFFSDVDEYQDVGDVPADQGRVLVERLMTRDVLFIDADAPVWEAARLMRERRVHRLIVTERGALCGVVSTLDLLGVIEEAAAGLRSAPGVPPVRPDSRRLSGA